MIVTVTNALRPEFLNHIHCTGDESRLTDCTIIITNRNLCDENEGAEVECTCEIGMNNIFDLVYSYNDIMYIIIIIIHYYACGIVTVQCFPLENAPSPPHQVSSSSAMILISTTTMTYTPVCSTESIPRSLGIHTAL